MGRDNNAIFGYGFLFNNRLLEEYVDSDNSDIDIELFDIIQQYCKDNELDIYHDRYWTDFEIFIGIVKHRVQNGNKTYSKENGWFSDKDQLTNKQNINFEVNNTELDKVEKAYDFIKKYDINNKTYKPRWMLFTFNT